MKATNITYTSKPKWLTFAPFIFLGLWSGGYPVAKFALQFAEPLTVLALRYALVVAIMVVLFAVLRPPLPKSPNEWLHLAVVGFLIQTVYFGMCYLAFKAGVAAGTVALLMSLQPILVGLAAPKWTGEAIGRNRWIGLILGLVGVSIVIATRSVIATPSLIGFAFAFLALLGITTGSLWEKRFGKDHHPITANLIGYTVGFVGIVPFMMAMESMHIVWTFEFGAALAYLVIGNSVIAVGLLLAMIRYGDVSQVSSLLFLVPPLAALLAWLLLGEFMPPIAWLGMAVAAVGVFVATRH